MVIDLARMHGAALAHELQQQLGLLPASSRPGRGRIGRDAAIRARMHQRLQRPRQEAVVEKEVLLESQFHIASLEVASAVAPDAMPQRQVLSARRRADRIGLNEAQPVEGAFQSGGREEAAGDGKAPKVIEGHQERLLAPGSPATLTTMYTLFLSPLRRSPRGMRFARSWEPVIRL